MRQVIQAGSRSIQAVDPRFIPKDVQKVRQTQIRGQLRQLGAVRYDLLLPETDILPFIIHTDETIEGIVYGKYAQDNLGETVTGRGAMVATDQRMLLIDRKPLFMKCNEISYQVVSAISNSRVAFMNTVILYTRLGNISMRTFNQRCAYGFVEAIEKIIVAGQGAAYEDAA